MRPLYWFGVFGLTTLAAWVVVRAPDESSRRPGRAAPAPAPAVAPAHQLTTAHAANAAGPDRAPPQQASAASDGDGIDSRPEPLTAAETMAFARLHGDERSPPLDPVPQGEDPDAPTAWDLSSPDSYKAYEQRRERQILDAYQRAAEDQLLSWRAQLDKAMALGAAEHEIAAVEEKIRRLEAAAAMARAEVARGP